VLGWHILLNIYLLAGEKKGLLFYQKSKHVTLRETTMKRQILTP
jgi:hypothetical protein